MVDNEACDERQRGASQGCNDGVYSGLENGQRELTMATQIETKKKAKPVTRRPWNVVLYNDDVHDFDEVVLQVQKATGKSIEQAYRITLEAHSQGKSVAFTGELERCQKVAAVLRRIRLQVDVDES